MRRVDLHTHTVHSDGTLTPTELVERACTVGLDALAVTDHDTTSALEEARAAGARLGVEVLGGCEITARLPSGTVHVLAYAFDTAEAGLSDLLARVREGRDERNRRILSNLADLGAPVSFEAVKRLSHGSVVARPHLARALVEAGHVADLREAFHLFLADGAPAYVQADVPPAAEAIEAVRGAGGVTVLAHPRSLKLEGRRAYEHVIGRMKDAGLSGLEVDHPSHDAAFRTLFGDLAASLDLVASGGSDFHGANKPHIELGVGDGSIAVGYETWERLLERRPPRGAV